jgi:hypothetical protein
MATIEGGANVFGEAVGLGDEVGSLEPGKQADLWRWRLMNRHHRLDLTELNLTPVLEAPVRQACPQAAQPGLCRKRARGQDGDGRGQGAGARWSSVGR